MKFICKYYIDFVVHYLYRDQSGKLISKKEKNARK